MTGTDRLIVTGDKDVVQRWLAEQKNETKFKVVGYFQRPKNRVSITIEFGKTTDTGRKH